MTNRLKVGLVEVILVHEMFKALDLAFLCSFSFVILLKVFVR